MTAGWEVDGGEDGSRWLQRSLSRRPSGKLRRRLPGMKGNRNHSDKYIQTTSYVPLAFKTPCNTAAVLALRFCTL